MLGTSELSLRQGFAAGKTLYALARAPSSMGAAKERKKNAARLGGILKTQEQTQRLLN